MCFWEGLWGHFQKLLSEGRVASTFPGIAWISRDLKKEQSCLPSFASCWLVCSCCCSCCCHPSVISQASIFELAALKTSGPPKIPKSFLGLLGQSASIDWATTRSQDFQCIHDHCWDTQSLLWANVIQPFYPSLLSVLLYKTPRHCIKFYYFPRELKID